MTWSDWPARRAPARAGFAAAVIALAVGAVALVDPVMAAVGAALLIGATAEVLLPTRYAVGPEGVETANALGRRRRPWSQLGPWSRAGASFELRGRSTAAVLRRHRSVRLARPPDPAAVEAWLAAQLGPPAPGEAA